MQTPQRGPGDGGAAPPPDGIRAVPDTADATRRRVSPATPFLHGATVAPLALLVMLPLAANMSAAAGAGSVALGLAGVAVVAGVVVAYQYLAWQRLSFWFDGDGDLRVDSGVLQRNERRLQLSRLQSVDVVQPLVARLFGYAALRVEVAGAGDSRVTLQFLPEAEASALRNEVLARAAGLRADAGAAPEAVLATVPPQDLAVSLLLRSSTVFLLLLTVLVLAVAYVTGGVGGLAVALVTGGIPILTVVGEFVKYFGFTVAESPDGLRLRFGLLQTETRTVPPGRVQAVAYVEPFLWRRHGWVRVQLNVAGVARDNGQGGREETLLMPVAPRPVAVALVARVLPGVDVAAIPLRPAPRRSSRRAPIQWSRLAVGWDEQVFVTRRGRITGHLSVVPHARTQSVRVTRGPWERLVGLASMHVDSTPGPVRIAALHRDAAEARLLAEEQADRARLARAGSGPERWMSTRETDPEEQR